MKKVILLGANGGTARAITPRLLEQDDVKLTVFTRHAERLRSLESKDVQIIEGDAMDPDALREAMKEQDIVISAMGGAELGDITEGVVGVMKELGVRRFIAISAGGIYDELPEPFNAWDKAMTGYTRPTNLKTADVIEKSALDYTILRPVWLTNKPTEEIELTQKGETYKGTETSRASLARFVADLVKNPERHLNENLGISQPDTDGGKPAAYR